jgi:hypothetical protein
MPILFAFIGVIAIITVFGLLCSLPVMLLWNGCLVGAVAGINEIGWLQAWGLMVLCGLLFKSSATNSKD